MVIKRRIMERVAFKAPTTLRRNFFVFEERKTRGLPAVRVIKIKILVVKWQKLETVSNYLDPGNTNRVKNRKIQRRFLGGIARIGDS